MPKSITSSARGALFALFLALLSLTASAQKTISGKITNGKNQQPVANATVLLKGTKTGTQTSSEGTFSITVPDDKAILVISAIGFVKQEVATSGKNSVVVELKETTTDLGEVVVIGYGTQKKKDLSGAISSIGASTIEKTPVASLDQALQGRAAGVQITNNDGAPGANISILIRGVGSPGSNGNTPLYVVDGYPVTGGINNINPSDIATIDVLKDVSATAIYGVRAANGVVIVTTKKGKKGSMQVSLDAYNAFQSKPKQYKLLNAQQWATLANEVADADASGNFKELAIWRTPNSLTNINWQDEIYRNSLTQNYSLGIRGGNEKVQLSTSLGYYDQKGIVLGSYFKRLTLGLNLDAQPTKWLKSSTSAKYTYQKANNPYGTGALIGVAQLPPTMDSGNRKTNLIKDGSGNYGFYNPVNTYVSKYNNPVYSIETNEFKNITNYLLVNSSLEATIFDGLKIKTLAGANISMYNGSFYQPEDPRSNDQYGLGGPTQNAFYSVHSNNSFEWLWENTLSYDKTFRKHSINFVAGYSAQKSTIDLVGVSGIPPNGTIRDLRQLRNLQFDVDGNGQVAYSLASQFARLTYKFADKYIITGTVRRDGSSKFDDGHKYGVFPSGAIAWKAKEELFLQNVSWLSDLKVRASYGKVGNESTIGAFRYQALYSTGAGSGSSNNLGYPFNNSYQGGIAATQPANPNLRWETDYQTDFGVDAAFLHGDLTLTVDYFNRRSKDFLLTFDAPAQSGYNRLTTNVGEMTNKGIEVALNYYHAVNKDLHYTMGLTFSKIKNKLTALNSGNTSLANLKATDGGIALNGIGWTDYSKTNIGDAVGEFYGYKSLGIFQTQAQIDALNTASVAKDPNFPNYQKAGNQPGDRYFADVNGDGHVNGDDRVSLGSPLPKFYGGLNIDVSYKSWDVNVYFYGVYGNKIFNYAKSSLESFQNRGFVGVQNVSYDYFVNHWTPTNPSNTYSRASYNDDAIGSTVASSAYIENGSFLKLKNLTVGYSIPLKSLSKIAISKLRFYISTQNLFTITKYSGLDPEVGIQGGNATQNGIDNGTYPGSRFYTVGLNVTF